MKKESSYNGIVAAMFAVPAVGLIAYGDKIGDQSFIGFGLILCILGAFACRAHN